MSAVVGVQRGCCRLSRPPQEWISRLVEDVDLGTDRTPCHARACRALGNTQTARGAVSRDPRSVGDVLSKRSAGDVHLELAVLRGQFTGAGSISPAAVSALHEVGDQPTRPIRAPEVGSGSSGGGAWLRHSTSPPRSASVGRSGCRCATAAMGRSRRRRVLPSCRDGPQRCSVRTPRWQPRSTGRGRVLRPPRRPPSRRSNGRSRRST